MPDPDPHTTAPAPSADDAEERPTDEAEEPPREAWRAAADAARRSDGALLALLHRPDPDDPGGGGLDADR